METEPVYVAVTVEDVTFLRSLGVNPETFAKLAFEQALRTAHTRGPSVRLQEMQTVLPPGFDVEKLIREASDNP